MEITAFVEKFHTLPGKTPSEKQKNINILIKEIPSDHDALLAVVAPNTQLEYLFKLKILLKLQRIPELIQILKYEEEYLPTTLLKNKWFCQKLADILDDNSSDFVSEILPFTSYVTRRRIITKLATFGRKLDSVFDEIYTRYGIYIAKDLLVGCSPEKIEDVLKTQKVVLVPYLQKLLYQKYPQVFGIYVTQQDGRNVDESVINYIASNDMNYFLELIEKFDNLSASLGKRLTRKLLFGHKDKLIKKADTFSSILHLKTVHRLLTEKDMKQFFINCSPPNINTLKCGGSNGFRNLQKILGKKYYKFLSELMSVKYKKSIYDYPDLVNDEMMELMDVDERETWIAIKRKNGAKEQDLIPFMKITDSIPLIKNKINVTSSVNAREDLVELLVKSCKINNDYQALSEVAEYVCSRHRNDDSSILRTFIHKLQLLFPFEKFDAKLWKSINSIMSVLNGKGDESFFTYDFYIKYVEFLFSRNKLTDEGILNCLKQWKKTSHCHYKMKNNELRKLLILKFVDLMPKVLEEGEDVVYEDLRIIILILQWNKDQPTDKISILNYPRLVESFRKAAQLAQESDAHNWEISIISLVFQCVICTKEESDFRDETIKIYFKVTHRYYYVPIDQWLLKHQPEVVYTNIEPFFEHLLYGYRVDMNLFKYMKKFTDGSFLEKAVAFCLNSIEQNKHLGLVFRVLAILQPPDKFLEIIAPFYPTEDKIPENEVSRMKGALFLPPPDKFKEYGPPFYLTQGKFEESEERKKGKIALRIAASFKYTSIPVLPEVLKYCKGDFKNYALEALYYLFYHSPENQLSTFINDIASKSVSVRKHAIFLTCIVGTVADVKRLLTQFIETEKNVSVQKHLFTATLKYFIRNPSDNFWDFVKICMAKLDKNDNESFNMLTNLRLIPEKYQVDHVIFVWEILKKNEDLDKSRSRLLSAIPTSLFKDLPLEFLLEVISDNFLKIGSNCETAINQFVVSSLAESSFKSEIMVAVFVIILRFKSTKRDSLEDEKTARDLLSCFVGSVICSEECYGILPVFAQKWHSLFSATDAMREHLKLSFTQFYLESGKDLIKFDTVVAEFLENLVSTYGVAIVDCFAAELKDSLKILLRCYAELNEDFFRFSLNLLKNRNDLVFYLLAIKLLPPKQPSEEKAAELFHEIIQILRQVPQESVQMWMNLYVMDMESTKNA